MLSPTDIASLALLRVGAEPIADIDDTTNKHALICKAAWPLARRAVLRAHSWNSATVRSTLAPLEDAPAWEFATQYSLPADCLHLMEVDTDYDWRIENGRILTDGNSTLNVRYIKDETDTGKYDPLLTHVMVLALAVEICEKITQSRAKRELLLDEFQNSMNEAMMADGQEQSPAEFEEDDWILSRA